MPQLVKGGKYVFGWASIKRQEYIRIPDEAFDEYKFIENQEVILMSGSKSSGGFSINRPESILASKPGQRIMDLLGYRKEPGTFSSNRLEVIHHGDRWFCWTNLEDGDLRLSNELIRLLELNTGNKLLVGRGSGIGPAFLARGKIYQEALKHKYLLEF